jgi:c-di-GMP-related signal transduction protein
MEHILPSLSLEQDIADALLAQKGTLGAVLRCVLEYERGNWQQAHAAINLNEDSIREAYRKSVGWSLTTLNGFAEPLTRPVS